MHPLWEHERLDATHSGLLRRKAPPQKQNQTSHFSKWLPVANPVCKLKQGLGLSAVYSSPPSLFWLVVVPLKPWLLLSFFPFIASSGKPQASEATSTPIRDYEYEDRKRLCSFVILWHRCPLLPHTLIWCLLKSSANIKQLLFNVALAELVLRKWICQGTSISVTMATSENLAHSPCHTSVPRRWATSSCLQHHIA